MEHFEYKPLITITKMARVKKTGIWVETSSLTSAREALREKKIRYWSETGVFHLSLLTFMVTSVLWLGILIVSHL